MPKMSKSALRAMVAGMKANALAAQHASRLTNERSDAMMYYLGDMSKDMPAMEGRSQAVSTDVADTIEGLMPQLMDIFAGSDEVVKFNPVGPEDVQAAEQETDYLNHVFMNRNPGFMVLYSYIKDALLSKVGVVKGWWEEHTEEENETYYDLTDQQYAVLTSDQEIEITEYSSRPAPPEAANYTKQLHDVTATKSKTVGEAKVLGVPPEEFGIEPNARSIKDSNYCFHKVIKSQAELIDQGFDKTQLETLPTYAAITNTEEISRSSVDETNLMATEDINRSARPIEITEHYVRMDYSGDGACLYRVTTGGEGDEILRRDGADDIIKFDEMPFAAMTPIIITHRFFGRSIADLVMDIQKIKTALKRALLDNAYLANNPRVEVAESFASDTTLDDLLVSRQGGIIRTRQPGGINWQVVPTIGNQVFPLLEYEDMQREMRTGVTKQGQGLDANALQNQSATAVNQAFSMAQSRMRLIARVFAETGVKDLFLLLHGIIRKHGQQQQTVRLRNQWVNIDPRQWRKRDDMTVKVGLGTGDKAQQMAMMTVIMNMQKDAIAGGFTNLVNPQTLFNTAKRVTTITGEKDTESFFTDPSKQPPLQPRPDPKMMELQMKADIEKVQAQADITTQNAKTQAEIALAQQKFQLERELALINAQLQHEKHRPGTASIGPEGPD